MSMFSTILNWTELATVRCAPTAVNMFSIPQGFSSQVIGATVGPGSEQSWNNDMTEDTKGKMGRDRRQDDRHLRTVRIFSVSRGGKWRHWSQNVKEPPSTCTADVENVQVLMKVILSCDELCMFLSVGPDPRRSARTLLRSDGEGSHRVGNGDFTTATALTHLLPSIGTTINGEKIREVGEKVSKHAGCTNAAKIGQFSRTRPTKLFFLKWKFLCAEPRGQEDSRLVATLAPDEASGPVRSSVTTYFVWKTGQ